MRLERVERVRGKSLPSASPCIALLVMHHFATFLDPLPLVWQKARRRCCWNIGSSLSLHDAIPDGHDIYIYTPSRTIEQIQLTPAPHQHRDAFTKRENADENYAIRKREMEKLQALKEKIAEHQEHLKELDKNVYVGLSFFPYLWRSSS